MFKLNLFLLLSIICLLLFSGCVEKNNDSNALEDEDDIVCAQDVKQCPDGSYVSRNPKDNCNFLPC